MKRLMWVMTAMVLGATVVFSQGIDQVKSQVRSMVAAEGLNAADADEAVRSFIRLMDRGVSEAQAKHMIKLAVQKTKNAAEIDKVATAISETYAACGQSKEVCDIAETCLKSKISTEDCERLMTATQYALKKNASPRQVRILAQDMLKKSVDAEGINAAICAVGDAVEKGESSSQARLRVSRVTLDAAREGLDSEALVSRIREQTQDKTQLRDQTRERTQDRLNQELGAGEAKQEQYQQRREEQKRLQAETSSEGLTGQHGDISMPDNYGKPDTVDGGQGDVATPLGDGAKPDTDTTGQGTKPDDKGQSGGH